MSLLSVDLGFLNIIVGVRRLRRERLLSSKSATQCPIFRKRSREKFDVATSEATGDSSLSCPSAKSSPLSLALVQIFL